MSFYWGPKVTTDELIILYDAGNPQSYQYSDSTWYDLAKYNILDNDATLVNGTGYTYTNGGAIHLDGTDDYVSSPIRTANFFEINNDFTVEIWVRPLETITANGGLVCNQLYYTQTDPGGFGVIVKATNQVALSLTSGTTTSNDSKAPITLSESVWQQITYTYSFDGTTGYINGYKNGILTASDSATNYQWTTEDVVNRYTLIGKNTQGGWGNYFEMEIAIVRIYKKALSDVEIKNNYDAIKERFFPPNMITNGLDGWWILNEDYVYDKTFYDLSGNAMDGLSNLTPTFDGDMMYFNGIDTASGDDVDVLPAKDYTIGLPYSIGVWISNYNTSGTFDFFLGGIGTSNFLLNSSNNIAFRESTSSYWVFASNSIIKDGESHHMVFTCDGTNILLYVDAVHISTITPTTSTRFYFNNFGCGYGSDLYKPELNIGEVYIYNRQLSEEEVDKLYKKDLL